MGSFKKRAEQRRQTWQGSRVASHAEMVEVDRELWSRTLASERLDTVWAMALEAWSLKRGDEPAPRLQGSPVGIRKRAG